MSKVETDPRRLAAALVLEYGEGAEIIAARRVDALIDLGNLEGRALWQQELAIVRSDAVAGAASDGPIELIATPLGWTASVDRPDRPLTERQ